MPSSVMTLIERKSEHDVHLTGNPQITFFKAVFKRHTKFLIESIEHIPTGDLSYGGRFFTNLKRNGDLINQIYLVFELNSTSSKGNSTYFNWVNNTAHSLIKEVSISIGEETIDSHDGVFLDILSELNDPTHEDWPLLNKHAANNAYLQSSESLVPNKLFIPLQFWFCKNPGMALPIVSLDPTITVRLDVKTRNLASLINCNGNSASVTELVPDVKIYVDYIFLDKDERRMFLQSDQEYLIEQVQQLGGVGKFVDFNKRINLDDFNHPVKELIWVIRDKTAISENTSLTNISNVDTTLNEEGSSFSHKNDLLNYNCTHANNTVYIGGVAQNEHFSNMTLSFDGINICPERESTYFRTVQPISFHGILPFKKIYLFSFSLRPTDQQPTGTMNFSAIDKIIMNFNGNIDTTNSVISVYAINYNVLRFIKSGSSIDRGDAIVGIGYRY